MKKGLAILVACFVLAGTSLAFMTPHLGTPTFPSWDNHSPTQIDYTAWQAWSNDAGNDDVPAFASSWANATALVINDEAKNTKPIIIDIASASTTAYSLNTRIDPVSKTTSSTLSVAGLGAEPMDTTKIVTVAIPEGATTTTTTITPTAAEPVNIFSMDSLKINTTADKMSVAFTSGSADATAVWESWAVAPSASAAFVNSTYGLSEGWSMSAAVSDWDKTAFEFDLAPFVPGPGPQ
jgi:hypothetical protein